MNGTSAERGWLEFGALRTGTDVALLLALALALVAWTIWQYRRDAASLSRRLAYTLLGLRLAALVGLAIVGLEPQWRTQRAVRIPSRVAVLVDTSLSMQFPAEVVATSAASPSAGEPPATRHDAARSLLEGPLLERLRRTHEVTVYRFDSSLERLASLGVANSPAPENTPDWLGRIAPRGGETRLGEALRDVLAAERRRPLSGIVLVTDGAQTSGLAAETAAAGAKAEGVRLVPIGLGASQLPANVQVAELTAPQRAQPGDPFSVTGYITASGMEGKPARLTLVWRPADDEQAAETSLGEREIVLPADGQSLAVEFEVTPSELGRRKLELRVAAEGAEGERTGEIEIVDRKIRVLLAAGGPAREYQYLRGLLNRDREVVVDVFLQTAAAGASQDAAKLLSAFPATPQELEPYDVVIAVDCDWLEIDPAAVDSLERWVAEQAGGLVLIAGVVNTDRWAQQDDLAQLKRMFPVEFSRRLTLASLSPAATRARRVELTAAGREADFLRLADGAGESAEVWKRFDGVFSQQAIRRAKPGATVYATLDDPTIEESANVLLAGQFYGAGQVFYVGSGELWRMRRLGEGYFERLYTQILRHVAEGRLTRGAARGLLLADHDRYTLGQTAEIELRLTSPIPGGAEEATLEAIAADGSVERITLRASGEPAASFRGAWTPRAEGDYRLEAALPDASGQRLSRGVSVVLPELERQRPQRNDSLLARLATETEGKYFVGPAAALAPGGVVDTLPDRAMIRPQLQEPRSMWDNGWVLGGLACLLSIEWLLRRLARLG